MKQKKENIDRELEKIKQHYDERAKNTSSSSGNTSFSFYASKEREIKYVRILNDLFKHLQQIKILEIGAGGGKNLLFFNKAGIPWKNIYANELLPERVELLKKNTPEAHIFPGNALDLQLDTFFDIVFQSMVFSSVLDNDFRKLLADKMAAMVKPGGIILWYDFIYDNPNNKNVSGISKKVVRKLFPQARNIDFIPVTLAPPIGRRVGKAYNIINKAFPFLRTHVIAVIQL